MQQGTTFTGTDGLEHGWAGQGTCTCGWEPPAHYTKKGCRKAVRRHRAKVGTRVKPKRPTGATEGTKPDPGLAAILAERRTNPTEYATPEEARTMNQEQEREARRAARDKSFREFQKLSRQRNPYIADHSSYRRTVDSLKTGTKAELDNDKAQRENDPAYQKRKAERLARNVTRM